MADSFQLEVATPERILVQEPTKEAQIPAEGGMLGVLPDHAALLSLLGTGQLTYTLATGEKRSMVISGGYLQILENHVRVLADRAELANEIDIARAQKSLERAKERMGAPASAGMDVSRALNAMKRAEARIAAAKLTARG
ncbi:MAG: ATP synthase F1 subunit epsilon [Bryobacteraceae bacterium]|nr:ATP synthase F1 subunit epsilon [Bryobacteraceae bacterium]